jgi:hypothetical protein
MAVVGWVILGGAFLLLVMAVNGSWVNVWHKFTAKEGGTAAPAASTPQPGEIDPKTGNTVPGAGGNPQQSPGVG